MHVSSELVTPTNQPVLWQGTLPLVSMKNVDFLLLSGYKSRQLCRLFESYTHIIMMGREYIEVFSQFHERDATD